MKQVLPILLSLMFLLAPDSGAVAAGVKTAQPMAILIAADWCENCKIIKPKLHDAYKDFEGRIHFVTLDVTDDARLEKAQKEAVSLGQPRLLVGQFATGWVALIDRNGKQVGQLKQDMSVEDMRKALQALVSQPG